MSQNNTQLFNTPQHKMISPRTYSTLIPTHLSRQYATQPPSLPSSFRPDDMEASSLPFSARAYVPYFQAQPLTGSSMRSKRKGPGDQDEDEGEDEEERDYRPRKRQATPPPRSQSRSPPQSRSFRGRSPPHSSSRPRSHLRPRSRSRSPPRARSPRRRRFLPQSPTAAGPSNYYYSAPRPSVEQQEEGGEGEEMDQQGSQNIEEGKTAEDVSNSNQPNQDSTPPSSPPYSPQYDPPSDPPSDLPPPSSPSPNGEGDWPWDPMDWCLSSWYMWSWFVDWMDWYARSFSSPLLSHSPILHFHFPSETSGSFKDITNIFSGSNL